MDKGVEENRHIEDDSFSVCMENAIQSVLGTLLGRKLTVEEIAEVQKSNRARVPDRGLVTGPMQIRQAMLDIFNATLAPFGFAALPKLLTSSSEVADYLKRDRQILIVFPVRQGTDTHVNHITGYSEGKLFYTNDNIISFTPKEMDRTLATAAETFGHLFNAFSVSKPPPFPVKSIPK